MFILVTERKTKVKSPHFMTNLSVHCAEICTKRYGPNPISSEYIYIYFSKFKVNFVLMFSSILPYGTQGNKKRHCRNA